MTQIVSKQSRTESTADVRGFFSALGIELPEYEGTNLTIRCFANPAAHSNDDSNPSASINVETGAWICHACGQAGGPHQAASALGLSERRAARLLAEHGLKGHRAPRSESSLKTTEEHLLSFQQELLRDTDRIACLQAERGWSQEAIEFLGLGFDGERIVFALRDSEGTLVGVGRYLPASERGERPKMLAEAGSRRELFPAPEQLDEGDDYLFLVEGEPDVVAAHSVGIPAVAVPGVASWQPEWKQRFAGRRVVVVFDSDKPGRQAAAAVASDLAPVAAEVRVLDLERTRSDGSDLTDFLLMLREEGLGSKQAKSLLRTRASRAELVEPERGSHVLEKLVSFLRRYVVLGEAETVAVALWIVHTHTFAAAEATPYLAITSAEKESGKTRLLETLELLVAKPWLTGRATPAVLTRKIDAEEPTLLLDESDAAFGAEKEYAEVLRGILNTGYRRGGKTSIAVRAGQDFTYRDLATFSPKAIAGIGKLPDTVQSRSIPIRLKRKSSGEQVERFRRRDTILLAEPVREQVERFASAHLEDLDQARPGLPDELGDRAADVWEPLLAIAELAGGNWPGRARHAALSLSAKQSSEDDSLGVRLLGDLRQIFLRLEVERLFTEELLEELAEIEEAPWADWYGKRITPRKVAQFLKPYGIKPKTIRIGEQTKSGYERGWFADAWSRYLPTVDLSTECEQALVNEPLSDSAF